MLLALIVLGVGYLIVRRRRGDQTRPAEPADGAPGAGPAPDAP